MDQSGNRPAGVARARHLRDRMREHADRATRGHPIPAIMVGVGVAGLMWLAVGGRSAAPQGRRHRPASHGWPVGGPIYDARDDYRPGAFRTSGYETANDYGRDYAYRVRERAAMASHVARRTGEMSDPVRRRVERTTRRVRETVHRAERQAQRPWQNNPLLIGAAATLVGAVFGFVLLRTERDNELLDETRRAASHAVSPLPA